MVHRNCVRMLNLQDQSDARFVTACKFLILLWADSQVLETRAFA